MNEACLQDQFRWYLRNCAVSDMAARLLSSIRDAIASLDGVSCDDEDALFEVDDRPAQTPRQALGEARRRLSRYRTLPPSEESLELNVGFASEEFAFDSLDRQILLLVLRYDRNDPLERFADQALHKLGSVSAAVAALLNADPKEVHRRLIPGGTLIDTGMLVMETEGHGLSGRGGCLRLPTLLSRTMYRPYRTRAEWCAAILGTPLVPRLHWDDYAHLHEECELAAAVLNGAADGSDGETGINILLHGPVGTGKTEFAKTVAAHTGYAVWSIGETDESGDEPNRSERLAALRLAQRLLARRGRALLLVDEAEDLLAPGMWRSAMGTRSGSKVFLSRLLEDNRVPVVWTCNQLHCIDLAVLRRMSLAIEMDVPTVSVRQRIWQRVLADQDLAIEDATVRHLAKHYPAPPALLANAARVTRLAGGGAAELERALAGVLRLITAQPLVPAVSATAAPPFHLGLINCAEDIVRLADALAAPAAGRRWSLCIDGAPGTGKSEFARYLASRLGLEIIQKRASDVLSMFVGGTEQQIAAAFREARDRGAILVFDEAESLLQDRTHARHGWEISQVNEMLTWMESHPLPFICTTNFAGRLDSATLRRFVFKLQFRLLSPQQAGFAFVHYFGQQPPRPLPADLAAGDFASVDRKSRVLGRREPETLVKWLEEEAAAKSGGREPIGFLAPHRRREAA